MKPKLHPLDDPNITWLTPQDLDRIKGGYVDREQAKREANYHRQNKEKPSWMLIEEAKK